MSTQRRSKVIEMGEVGAFMKEALPDGGSVLIGGTLYSNRPGALVRELAKTGIRDLSVIGGPINGWDVDMLIGAGVVKETLCPMVTAMEFGMAPNFRKAAETGSITAHGIDEMTLLASLMAAKMGIPYMPLACFKGTELVQVNPLLKRYAPPFGDDDLYAARALSPHLALIHAQESDVYGNIRDASRGASHLEAKASQKVIVSVERIVPHEAVLREPWRTTVPCIYVDAVVEVPYGAHPVGSPGLYGHDQEHLRHYWQAAEAARQGDPEPFQVYLKEYVLGPVSPDEYLERIGGLTRLHALEQGSIVGQW